MATLSFTYISKLGGPEETYVTLGVWKNGEQIDTKVVTFSELREGVTIPPELEHVFIDTLLRGFVRKWAIANPSGTLVQLKNALEAKEWAFR